MAPGTKRAAAAAATGARVVEKARAAFEKHGYDAVTLRDVAKAAGVSTGAIFAHFHDKAELFEVAMGRKVPMAVIKDMLIGAAERGEIPPLGNGAAAILLRDLYGAGA